MKQAMGKKMACIFLVCCLLAGLIPGGAFSVSAAGTDSRQQASLDHICGAHEDLPELEAAFPVEPEASIERAEAAYEKTKEERELSTASQGQGITRAQWIGQLVSTFSMTVAEENAPDNYYCDISRDDDWYWDVMTAVEFGLIDLEAGMAFHPTDPATREFAAHTLNFCLGYQLEEDASFTFSEQDTVQYPKDIQVSINLGWFALSDGNFLPNQAITEEEQERMLVYANDIIAGAQVNPEHENTYEFYDSVVVVPYGTTVNIDENSIITIENCPVQIQEGTEFVLFLTEIPTAYRATQVTLAGDLLTITTTQLELSEVAEQWDLEGVIEVDLLDLTPADGVEFIYIFEDGSETQSRTQALRSSKKLKDIHIAPEKPLSIAGIDISYECTLSDIELEYKFSLQESYAIITSDADVTVTANTSLSASSLDQTLDLTSFGIPGIGRAALSVDLSVDGTASVTTGGKLTAGIAYNKKAGFRTPFQFEKTSYLFAGEANLTCGLVAGIYMDIPGISANTIATIGARAQVAYQNRPGQVPEECLTIRGWLYAHASAYGAVTIGPGKKFLDERWVLYDENNSPVRSYNHYEDGLRVERCTYGDDGDYYTSSGSRYCNGGLSRQGSYGSDAEGNPVQIYTYTLDQKGQATITGFFGNASSLLIPATLDGYTVVAIGEKVFQDHTGIRSVVISDGIVTIGAGAFRNCTGLRSISLPGSLLTIEESAFYGCTALIRAELPHQLKTLGGLAFGYCTNLRSVFIPDTVEDCVTAFDWTDGVYSGPFYQCSSLTNIRFGEGIQRIPSKLLLDCTGLTQITIPESVTTVGEGAFQGCTSLTQVSFPESLTKIEQSAFYGCKRLKEAVLPEALTYLGGFAFGRCTGLESVYIPAGITECYDAAESIGYTIYSGGPFYLCDALNRITFETGITTIPKNLFYGCTGLTQLVLPDTVTRIGKKAFMNCTALKEVTFSSHLRTMEEWAFFRCSSLTRAELPEGLTDLCGMAFGRCTELQYVFIPKTVTNSPQSYEQIGINVVNGGPFYQCASLTEIELEEGIAQIPDDLFFYCTGVRELSLPESVTQIGKESFKNCESLEQIILPEALTQIENQAFYGCASLQEIAIPNPETELGTYGFSGCSSLAKAVLPDACPALVEGLFQNCSSLAEVQIPETVAKIETKAFQNCTSLTQIILPPDLQTIESYAFQGSGLEDIIIPNRCAGIGNYAFQNCTSLENATISDSVGSVGKYLFDGCKKLRDVKLGTGLTEIPDYAFSNCPALESLILPYRITTIGRSVFLNDTAFVAVTIPRATTSISANAFSYPDQLTIYGVAGTTAETYAKEIGAKFVGIQKPVESIVLSQTTLSLMRGKSVQLTASVTPADFTDVAAWKSSDPAVVTVDDNGMVKAVAAGTATVSFVAGQKKAVCQATVVQPVTSISLNQKTLSLDGGDTFQLVVTEVKPSTAQNQKVTWSSSDENVATVSPDGLVTAYRRGTADIIATAQDGSGVSARCTVAVISNLHQVSAVEDLQSVHPYTENSNEYWQYTIPDAQALLVTFSEETEVEADADYLYLYTGDRIQVGAYTGRDLAGKTVAVPGDTVRIQLVTDGSYNLYGFAVTAVEADTGELLAPSIIEVRSLSATSVKLSWTTVANAQVYEVWRGREKEGAYTMVEAVADTTFTDEGLTENTTYFYKIRARNGEVYSEYSDAVQIATLIHTHRYESTVTPPTCTEGGYTTHTCTICGDRYTDEPTAALGHDFGAWRTVQEASCEEAGREVRTCTRCATEESREIAPTGHRYESEVTPPTCTEEGYTTHTCTICGDRYTDEPTAALGHDFGAWRTVQEASCEEAGREVRTCTRCATEESREIAPTGHRYESEVTLPTCTEKGYTTYTCTVCGNHYRDKEVAALGHDFELISSREPTATEEGYKTYACTRCQETKTDVVPATGPDPASNPFTDVDSNRFYYEPVLWAVEQGITSGVDATHFRPERGCTRGQVVTFLWRAFGCPEPQRDACAFTDLRKDAYYYQAVLWAVEAGITTGIDDTHFGPDRTVTRGQFVTFLWRAEGKPAASGANPFRDVQAGRFYYDAVLWAAQTGITSGVDPNRFAPDGTCTRGQVVTFLYRDLAEQ